MERPAYSIAMDATTTAAKAVATGADADAAPSSPRAARPEAIPGRQEPLPGDAAAAADPASATTTTSTAVVERSREDEQVEKFYALLANIRAMRGMYRGGSAGAGASTDSAGEVCGRGTKRASGAEPSWRPAFRMEDFEEAPGRATKKERRDDACRRPENETTDEEGEDVEKKGLRDVTPSSHRNV